MTKDEIRTRLGYIADIFDTQAKVFWDIKLVAQEAAELLKEETVPLERIREIMNDDNDEYGHEDQKAAWRVLKALERREKDAGRGDQDRGRQ